MHFLSLSQAQTLSLESTHLQTGIDITNENYLAFSGFEYYYKRPFKSNEWEKVEFKSNTIPLSSNFPYKYYHIKGKNYLVYKGCGEVYEFINDSIIRIDNSFQHKNQFDASSFVYNDEIYFFGGYGLFTFKNILTKFDFKTKEWELVKYSNNSNTPKPRDKAISFLKDDALYIISGYAEIDNAKQLTESSQQLFDIWKLNLKTKTWDFIGYLNNEIYYKSYLQKGSSYKVEGKFYADYSRLINIDIENNKLHLYKPNNKFAVSFGEKYNNKTKEIIYALPNTNESNTNVEIIIEPFLNYSNTVICSNTLIKSKYLILFIVLLALAIVIISVLIRKKIRSTHKNSIDYSEGDFYYKSKRITTLSPDETKLLKFLFDNKKRNIQVSELIDVISDDTNANYNTLSKKKDLVFNSLKQKLSFILTANEDKLFINFKNSQDKRIKEIRLNKDYFN